MDETFTQNFPVTSPTMLRDVASNPSSPRWNEFARLYEPLIRRYVAREQMNFSRIQKADQDDLVQESFLAVARAMSSFQYDKDRGRFRGYLFSVVRRMVVRHQRKTERRVDVPVEDVGEDGLGVGEAEAVREDGEHREMMLQVWTLALARVFRKGRFTPNAQSIFRRHVLENADVQEVAAEFRMKPNAVYQIKDRVLRAVRRELDELGASHGGLADVYEFLVSENDIPPPEGNDGHGH